MQSNHTYKFIRGCYEYNQYTLGLNTKCAICTFPIKTDMICMKNYMGTADTGVRDFEWEGDAIKIASTPLIEIY